MSGLASNTKIVYIKGDADPVLTEVGRWVDGVFAAFGGSIQTVDTHTQKIALTDPSLVMVAADQNGNTFLRQITAVYREDLTKVPAWQMLEFKTQNGSVIQASSQAVMCTRINNVINGQTADQFQVGDSFVNALEGYSVSDKVRRVFFPVQPYGTVPNVITMTWGVISITKVDAETLVTVVSENPEQCDQSDLAVFNEVLGENVIHDPIMDIDDVTAAYKSKYVYRIETDAGSFTGYMNSFLCGFPIVGPTYQAMPKATAKQVWEEKGQVDSAHILSKFGNPNASNGKQGVSTPQTVQNTNQ